VINDITVFNLTEHIDNQHLSRRPSVLSNFQ